MERRSQEVEIEGINGSFYVVRVASAPEKDGTLDTGGVFPLVLIGFIFVEIIAVILLARRARQG